MPQRDLDVTFGSLHHCNFIDGRLKNDFPVRSKRIIAIVPIRANCLEMEEFSSPDFRCHAKLEQLLERICEQQQNPDTIIPKSRSPAPVNVDTIMFGRSTIHAATLSQALPVPRSNGNGRGLPPGPANT